MGCVQQKRVDTNWSYVVQCSVCMWVWKLIVKLCSVDVTTIAIVTTIAATVCIL